MMEFVLKKRTWQNRQNVTHFWGVMPGAENPVPVSCICCAYYVLRFVVIASPLQGGRNNLGDACNLHWNSGASKRHCFGNITERSRILGRNIGRVRLLPTRFALFYQLCICLDCCGIWSRERIWWKFSNCRNRMSIPVFSVYSFRLLYGVFMSSSFSPCQ